MKRISCLLLGLGCLASVSAQLKVESITPQKPAPETVRPIPYDSLTNIQANGTEAYYKGLIGQRILFYPRDVKAPLREIAYFNFLAGQPTVVRIDTTWLVKPRKKVRPGDFRVDTLYSNAYRPRFYKNETTAACGCSTVKS